MGHYDKYQRKQERKQETNPIWRGIGCVLIVVVLLMSYALTAISVPPLITTGLVPPELLGKIGFPDWVFRTPVLSGIATFLHGFDHLGMA